MSINKLYFTLLIIMDFFKNYFLFYFAAVKFHISQKKIEIEIIYLNKYKRKIIKNFF